MRIVVGLGNPGRRYVRTRHNAGFRVVEHLGDRWGIPLTPHSAWLVAGQGSIQGIGVVLVKPQRYMNCSGEALTHLQWPWRPGDLIVVHDDIDLPLGRLRVRHDGGCGGHLGLESLGRVCGRDFDRVRLGVGRPPQGVDPAEYVLADFAQDELRTLAESVDRASLAVECLLTAGLAEAMNRFNMRRTVSCPEFQSEDHPEKN